MSVSIVLVKQSSASRDDTPEGLDCPVVTKGWTDEQ